MLSAEQHLLLSMKVPVGFSNRKENKTKNQDGVVKRFPNKN